MTNNKKQTLYEIEVAGILDQDWRQWFNSHAVVIHSNKEKGSVTTLTVPVSDQSALRGILGKIWDLNLTLISLHRLELGSEKVENEMGKTG